jgi:Pectate lyase superfamily protein
MAMDRRHLMGLGAIAAALSAHTGAEAATSNRTEKAIQDFGIVPDAGTDQSAGFQAAIDELTAMGQPVIIPAGHYRASRLRLPPRASFIGVPGLTIFAAPSGVPVFESQQGRDLSFRGIAFAGIGLFARDCSNLTVMDCQILSSGSHGLVCSGTGLFLAFNRATGCAGSAIWAEGDGMITNNMIMGPGQFGLRIGTDARLGMITVMNNRIEGVAAGIGVSSSDKGYALISMNFIAGTKEGGIRAVSGEKLTGSDLTRGGSEAFRSLAIAANVSV